ncbi:MAG: hypothetical protein E7291_10040 [Lachnospiraceae bacterium]|nr:hypothetical protein [Lachnospiraceae bacterium]
MDKETRELFNALVGEMDKLAERINKRFENIDMRFEKMDAKIELIYENLSHEINACKLDKDTLVLLVQKVNEIDERVNVLEEKQKRRERFHLL